MKVLLKVLLLFVALSTWSICSQAEEVVGVKIERMEFVPQRLVVKVGTKVAWLNMEKRTNHSVFFQQEGLEESDRLFPGETWQRTFDKPGVYAYICGPHPHMTGVIEVTP
jgi:plastocyanin